jgi:hypothetical protein
MDTLKDTVKVLLQEYAGAGLNSYGYFLADDEHQVYAINMIDLPVREHDPMIVFMVRIVEDQIIIEADNTDKPLYRKLIARGIAPEKITLAYAGNITPQPYY